MKAKIYFIFLMLIVFNSCDRIFKKKVDLMIIPEPQTIRSKAGNYSFADSLALFTDQDNKQRAFALKQLRSGMPNIIFSSVKDKKPADIIIETCDKNREEIGDQGYYLDIDTDKIILRANTETGIFYAVQTLRQLFRTSQNNQLPCMEIVDWPALPYRGWQDDISRGPIPTMDFLKRQIQTMAAYKQNLFTLYTEHVFKLNKHPKIAPDDGITAEEIKELVEYAKQYHVEMVGNFQSFGHFEHILKVPEYNHLKETEAGWVLSPAYEESYDFLKDAYDEIAPIYESEFFNINCDETWGLGHGASKGMVDSLGLDGVYAYHVNRINQLLKSHDKRVMMWGDIAVNNPGIINKLPKDLIVLSWGYGPEESFDKEIIPFTKLGFDFMVCPGVGCWSKIWPEYESAIINISNYVRDGYHHGAMGMLNTTWDDDGENLFNYNWYPLIWGAEVSWNPISYDDKIGKEMAIRQAKFNHKFGPLFFNQPDNKLTKIMVELSELGKFSASRNLKNSRFWSSISEVVLASHTADEITENQQLLEKSTTLLNQLAKIKRNDLTNADIIDYMQLALKRVNFIAQKQLLGIKMSTALYEGDANMEQFQKDLNQLADKVQHLKMDYKNLWNRENRNWWLDTNLVKFDQQSEDLQKSYLNVLIQPTVQAGKVTIELKKMFDGGKIFYTLDGSKPSKKAIEYKAPFTLDHKTEIRAIGWLNENPGRESSKTVFPHLALGKTISIKHPYNANYSGGGKDGLINGEFGSDNFRDGKWQGFEGVDLVATIDLGDQQTIEKIKTRFCQAVGSWIFQPKAVEFYISNDNKEFQLVKKFQYQIHKDIPHQLIKNYQATVNEKARYIKVVGRNIKDCPEWHVGNGGKAWLFIDEIVVN